MNVRDYPSVEKRRKALESARGTALTHTGSYSLDEQAASTRNCENMIGITQIPVGVAGPLRIAASVDGKAEEYYLPLATTEGALVASVNRGSKAITESGGASVDHHRVGASRGPVFRVSSLTESRKLYEFLDTHFTGMKRVAEGTSSHLTLTNVTSRGVGRYRYVRFLYDTQDAMGLNMVTIATDAVCRYVEKETGASLVALSGNFCTDKKPSWQNFVENRGHKVWAEAVLSKTVLADTLKTTAARMEETWRAKCMLGSVMSGSMGYNAQYANVLAALFIATGQDPAHVAECSIGVTTAERSGDDLYVGVYLPDLMVGIVGGGTGLATQKEALAIVGAPTVGRFAEVVGAAVLAGEISLLASLSQGSLAASHARLARGKEL